MQERESDKEKPPIQVVIDDGSHGRNITKNAIEGYMMTDKEKMPFQNVRFVRRDFVYVNAIAGGRPVPDDNFVPCRLNLYRGWWWGLLNMGSFAVLLYGIPYMIAECMLDKLKMDILGLLFMPVLVLQAYLMLKVQMRCRGMRDQLVGGLGKVVPDVIALCAAVMLRRYFAYDGSESSIAALTFLAALTLQLHGWGQILHLTGDIGLRDVLVEMFVEVVIYLSGDATCFVIVFSFCGVICYKYFSYSVPISLEDVKKDVDALPC